MKLWILPTFLCVEIAFFVWLGAPQLGSTGAWVQYLHTYFTDLMAQSAPMLLLAGGMTVVLLTGGIDLSIASMVALVASIMALFPGNSHFWWTAIPTGLAVGILLGFTNGLLISRVNIPPIIATLGTMILYRGLCFVLLGDRELSPFLEVTHYDSLGQFASSQLLVVLVLGAGGSWFWLSRWRRETLMIGGNPVAARYAGIPVNWRLCQVYAMMGLLAALAAVCFTARNGSVSASSLSGLELHVIVAVVLGGTRVQGGAGTLIGSVFGVLIIAVLDEGLRGASGWADRHLPFKIGHIEFILLGLLLVVGVWLTSRSHPRRH